MTGSVCHGATVNRVAHYWKVLDKNCKEYFLIRCSAMPHSRWRSFQKPSVTAVNYIICYLKAWKAVQRAVILVSIVSWTLMNFTSHNCIPVWLYFWLRLLPKMKYSWVCVCVCVCVCARARLCVFVHIHFYAILTIRQMKSGKASNLIYK
jgi:hypothetical protein